MKVTLEGDKLQFGFSELVDELDLEQKRELAKALIWDKELFNEFIDALAGDSVVSENYNSMSTTLDSG